MAGKSGREIIAEQPFSWKHLLLRWESMLVLLLVVVNIMNIAISDKYWSVTGLFRATNSFLNIAFMVLPMCFVLVLGDIDISVGSILAFSATMLGVTYNAGAPMGVAVLVALLTGTVCGCINGAIATQFTELNPMIITFGTQVVYRGLCEIILGDQSTGGLNNVQWFSNLYWGKLGGVVPYMFIIFVVCAVVFGIVQHKTTFGRRMYAIGANREAARYSGINVQGTRFIVFVLTGLFSAVAAIFTAASMGSINNAVGKGTEMDAIGICVLGGIMTDGGKGNFIGAMISVFLLGLLEYGLGLVNVSSNVMLVVKGALLVISVMIPNLKIVGKKKRRVA